MSAMVAVNMCAAAPPLRTLSMQVIAGAAVGGALALAWFWMVKAWLAGAVFPAVLQWRAMKMLCFNDIWRENPDEILYKEREWYCLRAARKRSG